MSPEDHGELLKAEIERLKRERDEEAKARRALIQEFSNAADADDIARKARNAIRDLMPDAIIEAQKLIKYAESESVRASLSKFVISVGLDKAKFEDDSAGELKKLFENMSEAPNTQDFHTALTVDHKFIKEAPFIVCRLCGEIYQNELDRSTYELRDNDAFYLSTLYEIQQNHNEWRFNHESLYHTEEEIRELELSKQVLTPKAANSLLNHGISTICGVVLSSIADIAGADFARVGEGD